MVEVTGHQKLYKKSLTLETQPTRSSAL